MAVSYCSFIIGTVAAGLVDRCPAVLASAHGEATPEVESTCPDFLVRTKAHDLALLAAHELQQRLGIPALILRLSAR